LAFWAFKYENEKEERRNMRKAQKHHNMHLYKKYLNSIRIYVYYRRKKEIQKLKLKEYCESQLVFKTYQTWVAKFNKRKLEIEQESQIERFKQRFLMAHTMQTWKRGKKKQIKCY
jgi:hypothetical protein